MKLLVTGGAGYIGSVVTHALTAAGHDVTVLDNLSTGHLDTLPHTAEFVHAELRDAHDVLTPEFDGVLHFAGLIQASESVQYPDKYWRTNVVGTRALLDAMRHHCVRRLVLSSTAAVYGTQDGPMDEDTATQPTNAYGATKLAVDMMITDECRAYQLGAVSLRYFNAAGAGLEFAPTLGERHQPETHLIPIALQAAAGDRDAFRMFGDDYPTRDGTCVRDYIHVEDLADAHLLALEAAQPAEHQIFNLGNGEGHSNAEVIEAVRQVTGSDFPVIIEPRRAGDPAVVVASSQRAHSMLGWKPHKPQLQQIIGDAWSFYTSANT